MLGQPKQGILDIWMPCLSCSDIKMEFPKLLFLKKTSFPSEGERKSIFGVKKGGF
jgi:hypothetical protein